MIDFTPNPVALAIGSIEIRWYGIGYVAAIIAASWLVFREARRRGERTDMIVDALIVVAVAALLGGRAYHVIDQWAYYKDHLAQIVLPPYSGLGSFGGLFTGLLAVIWLTRHYRVQEFACPGTPANAHFIPLFFYESVLSLIGVFVLLFLWRRFTARGRLLIAGDVGLLYFVWYGVERSILETLRSGWNWTFFGLATAQLVGLGAAAAAIVAIVVRHWWVRRHPESRSEPGKESEPAEPATELTEAIEPAE